MTLNRIGYKLGLAGLIGIILSIAAVANAYRSERLVQEANEAAIVQQQIANAALHAEAELRTIRFSNRGVLLATTIADIDKNSAEVQAAKNRQTKYLDSALALALRPENNERFREIKALVAEYSAALVEIAGLQRSMLEQFRLRNEAVGEWDRHLAGLRRSAEVKADAGWTGIEAALHDAELELNAVRAAAWRYTALKEEEQKRHTASHAAVLIGHLKRASDAATGATARGMIEQLYADEKKFQQATEISITHNDKKVDINLNRGRPLASKISEVTHHAVEVAEKAVADSRAHAEAEVRSASRVNLALGVLVSLVLAASMIFSFSGIARPMTRLNEAMSKMAGGQLTVEIPGAARGDEIGDIAKTVTVIRQNAEQAARNEAEARIRQDALAAAERKKEMIKMADDFEGAIGEIVNTVSSASIELEASATTLTATADRAQQLTTLVATASQDAAGNVQSVAFATEEMSSSVNEIGRQVQESSNIASEAVHQAERTNDRVGELAKAAGRIGAVVELINTIAGQTNLLALNATIEAARAGEAGRGFAVVASEVKALAQQTAKATGEISQQISGIQDATHQSVSAIKQIGETIGRMSEIASTIAAAVEEQGAATQEISRNIQQAARGTMEVNAHIVDVQRGASETGSASSQVLFAAQSLSMDSNRLKLEVGRFLNSVRAA